MCKNRCANTNAHVAYYITVLEQWNRKHDIKYGNMSESNASRST